MKFQILSGVFLVLLQACAVVDRVRTEPLESFYEIKYGFYAGNFQRLKSYSAELGLKLIFPTIPGEIFGRPTNDVLHVAEVTNSATFNLRVPNEINDKAAAISESGLNVVPSDTRVLRLGTFHTFPSYNNGIGGGAFFNKVNGEFLLLVYFSNAAEVSGTTMDGNERYDHQISISAPGWYWIKITELSMNSFRLSEFDGNEDDIEFGVLVMNALSI